MLSALLRKDQVWGGENGMVVARLHQPVISRGRDQPCHFAQPLEVPRKKHGGRSFITTSHKFQELRVLKEVREMLAERGENLSH